MQVIDNFGCIGNTILTAEGAYLDFSNPQPDQLYIEDIAIGLANTCRFAGQLPRGQWYSVAEHCVLGARLAMDCGDNHAAFAVLMHDAAEAYMGDCPKPLKQLLPGWTEIEDRLTAVIERKWHVLYHPLVKSIDMAMLKREKEVLFPGDRCSWPGFATVDAADVAIGRWPPYRAREEFLLAFELLYRPM